MATHSSIVAWRIPGTGAWWAAVYGVTESDTTDVTAATEISWGFWSFGGPLIPFHLKVIYMLLK